MSALRIEIGVTAAGIDRRMPKAEINQARRIVGADGNARHAVEHVVVHPVIPAQRRLHKNIAEMIVRRIGAKVDLSEAAPKTWGDPVQLQQLLLNLIMNA